jgi:UDP-glucose 4-epimerase
MNILITGGGGFIGSHLSDALSVENETWAIDNWLTGRRENGLCTTCDLLDRPLVYGLANRIKPDVVIHCAASYSDPDKWHRDVDTNVGGCINAASIAKHHGAHLIYFQTILPPISSYAISKLAGEQYLRLSGVPLTVLRLANIYGPRNISGPIPVFYKRLSEGQHCTVVNTTRDMVYLADLVNAVLMVVDRRLTGTFDVCSGVQTPIYELFNAVGETLGLTEALVDVEEPDVDDVQGTISPENGIPGWKAVISLRSGIEHTVASYREQGIDQTHTHLRLGATSAS